MTVHAIEEDLGISKLIGVHVKQDDTKPKKARDFVIAFKTFQSQFNETIAGVGGTGSTAVGFQPEIILPHTQARVWAQVFNNGSPFVAAVTQPVPSQPTVPASTVAIQNPNTYPVNVVISGGTITAVVVNGITVGTADGTYIVPSAGSISITYSVAPTWVWSNANANVAASGNSNVYVCSSISDAMASTPIGFLLQPGQHLDINDGTTEAYLVAFGSGAAPTVSVLSVNEQH